MRYFLDVLQTLSAVFVGATVIAFLVPIWREVIVKYLARYIQSGLDEQLENVRSELRKSEERLKVELQANERHVSTIADVTLNAMSGQQSAITARRLQAIDKLWEQKSKLDVFKMTSRMMRSIDLQAAAESSKHDQKTRDFFGVLSNTLPGVKHLQENKIASLETERPYLSPLTWALYSTYSVVILLPVMRLGSLALGQGHLIDDKPANDLLKTALPEFASFIDQFGGGGHDYLLEPLERKLLAATQEMLSGKQDDTEGLERARQIMEKARAANLQAATVTSPEVPDELKAKTVSPEDAAK